MNDPAMDNAVKLVRTMLGGQEITEAEDAARVAYDDAQYAAWVARNEVALPDAEQMEAAIKGAGFEFEDADEEHGECNFTLASGGWAWLGMRTNGVTDVVFGWNTGGYGLTPPDHAEQPMGAFENFATALRFVRFADEREVRYQEQMERRMEEYERQAVEDAAWWDRNADLMGEE